MRKLILILLSLLLLVPAVSAQGQEEPGQIIVNSQDWRDVYSAMLYGSLTNRPVSFLVSDRHSGLILNSIPSSSHLWIINSPTPYVTGFAGFAEGKGYTVENFDFDSSNFEFADEFETESFILVDDAYGYNAIAVAPYAVASRSYVIFADRDNIDEVSDLLAQKNAATPVSTFL